MYIPVYAFKILFPLTLIVWDKDELFITFPAFFMNISRFKHKLLIILIIIILSPVTSIARMPDASELVIETAESKHIFYIELADTPSKWERGLMFRKSLKEDQGMLFVFPAEQIAQFWMKNTLIPLDMLFIDTAGNIIKIKRNAEPKSLEIISSGKLVMAVLEIAGGVSKKLNIQTGDRVIHATFKRH